MIVVYDLLFKYNQTHREKVEKNSTKLKKITDQKNEWEFTRAKNPNEI